jgi:NADPH-dependent ferric siderophore reductase
MTTASELKRSAVVEVESEVRKTNLHNATDLDQRWSRHDDTGFTSGSTTASATQKTATKKTATKQVASATAFFANVESRTSLFPTIQQNPAPLWRVTPERVLRANRAA